MPHLAVPFPAGHTSGSGRLRCRLSNRPLPQCPRAPAAVAGVHRVGRLRVAGVRRPRPRSHIGPPISAGRADLAGTQGCPRNRTPRQLSTGRPGLRPGSCRTAALRHGHGHTPLSSAETWRSPAADRTCTLRRLRHWTQAATCGLDGGGSTSTRVAVQTMVSAARHAAGCGHGGSVRGALRNCGRLAIPSGRLLSTADTATVGGGPQLRETVAGPTSAGGMRPPPIRPGELAAEPVAELAAHPGHGWSLQG
jgi:hypothetical protein